MDVVSIPLKSSTKAKLSQIKAIQEFKTFDKLFRHMIEIYLEVAKIAKERIDVK